VTLWGRDHARRVLAGAVDDAVAGHGQLLLLSGEAGIGKTALAAELLRIAPTRGVLATWSVCRHGAGSPAYWPWVQTMRAIANQANAIDLGELLGSGASVTSAGSAAAAADLARFALFDRLRRALVEAARRQPMAVILDDLHWSDLDSLLALDFVAEQVTAAPLLLLGTYRESEADDPLLRVAGRAHVLELPGLDERQIAELMADVSGRHPDDALAREVWQRTGGNPFFAREVTRLLTADGTDGSSVSALTGVPLGVKAVLNARVATLSADGSTALRAGAVIGREFAVDVLAELAGWSTADAVEHLEEAVRRRVVVRQPSPSGRHRFTHDLFRDTVYDSLTPDQVRTLHLAVGRLLERKRGAGSAVPAAELATHFGAAVAAGDDSDDVIRCAVSYSAEAGHEAVSRLADEDACRHYERALSFATDAPDRTSLLSCLGHARYRCGRADAARRSFDDAGVLAGEHRDSGSLAQAALGWHRVGVRSLSHDRHGVAMIRQALAMIGDEGGPWPPLLLSALARDLHQQLGALDRPADRPEADRAPIPIARRAVSLARRFGDPAVLAAALLALHDALWRPGSARDRLPIVDEMAGLAAGCADRELFAQSRQLRAGLLLELGDPDGMQELAEYCRLAEATGTQNYVLGRLGGPVVPLEADGGGEGIEAFGRRGEPRLRALIALVRGDRDEAERIVSGRSLSGLPSPHDLEMLVFEGWLVGEVGTAEQRRTVYQAMLPYAGTGSVVGGCAAYQGAMDHHLGALALAMGEPAAAAGHLDAALEQYERVGARAWAAAARGERAALGAVRRSPSGSTPIPAGQLNVFRRDGAVWQLDVRG